MNSEYVKFKEERTEYIPPVIRQGYFSNLPGVLIPSQHVELDGDMLEKEDIDMLRATATPPPTPPEDTPGHTGCNIFGEDSFYIDPIYKDDLEYQRNFAAKLFLYNAAYNLPSFVILLITCIFRKSDIFYYAYMSYFFGLFAFGVVSLVLFTYVVGLCRNFPWNYVAFAYRIIFTTCCLGGACICTHIVFLYYEYAKEAYKEIREHLKDDHYHPAKHVGHTTGHGIFEEIEELEYEPAFSSPYMGLIICVIYHGVKVVIVGLIYRYKISVQDYRIPILIYAVTFTINPILVTLILNDAFKTKPKSYDLYQCIVSCYISAAFLISKPRYMERLFAGKVCPLREGELLYALLHYGL